MKHPPKQSIWQHFSAIRREKEELFMVKKTNKPNHAK